ncbi:hypothetical protein KDW_56950 [Dictyobacter vulcani]|uniref:Dephospho-CoA kinase n=1 Tax=Dictyobacter vulcani TaxID=2607529 RepID=A0A5J4KVA0_9CHLR|nr:dephospho-CoA kinase [Dictyobacter vulcani]GER91533.1 hypothetical protein KDW_56950 [Dictyobacter vulcani]
MPYVLGITGNIACGKTSVGRMVLELGGERYIDADALVHRLYEPGQPIALRVGELFGDAVLTADGGWIARRWVRLSFMILSPATSGTGCASSSP